MVETQTKLEAPQRGMYVYCIVSADNSTSLGKIGLENREVYTITYKGLGAVVHECTAEPYVSKDAEIVKCWIRKHQEVIDVAMKLFGTVLPMTFDMIIKSDEESDPQGMVAKWLNSDYENFMTKLEKFKDRQEFGIQLFWDEHKISEKLLTENEDIKVLQDSLKNETRGKGYFIEQKINDLSKKEIEKEADKYFKVFYEKINEKSENVKVGKVKKAKGMGMLANLSCLVQKDKVNELGAELDKIDGLNGFSVRFTGPWPPYSFVSD